METISMIMASGLWDYKIPLRAEKNNNCCAHFISEVQRGPWWYKLLHCAERPLWYKLLHCAERPLMTQASSLCREAPDDTSFFTVQRGPWWHKLLHCAERPLMFFTVQRGHWCSSLCREATDVLHCAERPLMFFTVQRGHWCSLQCREATDVLHCAERPLMTQASSLCFPFHCRLPSRVEWSMLSVLHVQRLDFVLLCRVSYFSNNDLMHVAKNKISISNDVRMYTCTGNN